MFRKTIIIVFTISFIFMLGMISVASADTIYINPGTTPEWIRTYFPPSEPSASEIATWVGYAGTLQWLYKQNVGGSEEGTYADSYKTEFSYTPEDPANAKISYVEGPYISESPLYLLIKDGKATPTLYIFDLGDISTFGYHDSWDGKEDIVMTGFWPGKGAISNVAILGPAPTSVPEPYTMLLLGSGLLGLWGLRRKFKK